MDDLLLIESDSYQTFSIIHLTALASVAVTIILLIRYFIRISKIFKLINNNPSENKYLIRLSESQNYSAFSFFKWIFIPDNIIGNERDIIALHENIHINRKHYIDRSFLELLSVFMWFNPILSIYKKELKNIHEFEVDREIIKQNISKRDYFELIYKYSTGISFSDISLNFNFSSLKERIAMMTKIRSSVFAYSKQILLLPIIAFLILNFSCDDMGKDGGLNNDSASIHINETTMDVIEEKPNKSYSESEEIPQFQGDLMGTLSSNLIYPKSAKAKGIEGKVILALTINDKGKIADIKVVNSVEESLDREAVRVARLLEDWKPASKDGKAIDSDVMLPIKFKLQ
jgi:TonB family protein